MLWGSRTRWLDLRNRVPHKSPKWNLETKPGDDMVSRSYQIRLEIFFLSLEKPCKCRRFCCRSFLTKTSSCKKLSNPLHKFSSSVENHAEYGRFGPEVFSTKHFLAQHTQKNILTRKKQKRERKDWGKNREARVDTTKNLTQDNPCVPLCVVDFI